MSNEPRGHHINPRFYLHGFTLYSKFLVLKIQEQTILRNQDPKNFGKKRDFNKIDGTEDGDPFCLEKFLGERFEPILANSIRNVEKTKRFEGEDRSYILKMITLLAIRNQYQRDNWDRVSGDALYQLTKIQLSIDSSITSEELDKISVKFAASRNTHIERELKSFTTILHSMANRKWTLIAAPDYMDFITSDYPVTLIWKDSKQYNISSPGYESLKTQVFFPLTKKIALIGDFEGYDETNKADEQSVSLINSNILSSAKQQIYTPKIDFYFLRNDEITQFQEAYLEDIKR